MLDQLLGAAVQEADMRIGPLDHLAVHLEHEAQHAVRGRMLRAEVERRSGLICDFGHQDFAPGLALSRSPAFSSPGSMRSIVMPSHGELSKSKLRNSWTSFTGS